jgi:glucose dehydrogenase
MDAPDDLADFVICGCGHGASIQHHDVSLGEGLGRAKPLGGKARFEGRAVSLRGAASERFDEESLQLPLCAAGRRFSIARVGRFILIPLRFSLVSRRYFDFMRALWMTSAAGLLLATLFLAHVSAQTSSKASQQKTIAAPSISAGDWPLYSRDFTSARYSPLAQITTRNVAQLAEAWSFDMRPKPGEAPPSDAKGKGKGGGGIASEATPIVIGGTMYLPAGNRVLALAAESGKQIWSYTAPEQVTNRALGYWPGEGATPPHIIFTAGEKMMSLNAATGTPDPGFGKEGVVDISLPWNGAPYIYKNKIILGTFLQEITNGPPGDVRTFDVRTGAKLWEFHTVPRPGEIGHETWLDDGWKNRSGVNVWGWYFTVDEARDILYMPIGGPAGNYWGGDRPGNNLFGNSLVAVDANTGKYKWHFQVVHHDLWDTDLPAAPSLFDVTKDGKRIPALAVISKNALMFILDRTNGKPIFGVEERPVPKGEVPGEWYSPTQPFPVKPPPLARQSFSKSDMVTADDTTPEHAQACQELWEKAGGYYNAGPFTPFLFHQEGAPPKSSIQFPGNGGPNWGGTAADPSLGYVFVSTHDAALTGWIEKKREGGNYGSGNGSPQPYDRGSISGPGPYTGFSAQVKDAEGHTIGSWPCQKPPWGRLFAVNANTGDIAWEVTLGLNEGLPPGKQNTGGVGSAGPTATAGGVLFIGATTDRRFRAFDSKTGKELWVARLPKNANANPMVYAGRSGKEYVAVVATDAVHAFALP